MKKNYTRTTLYLSPATLKMLTWLATVDDRSPSYVVRRLIQTEYDRRAGPPLDSQDAAPDVDALAA